MASKVTDILSADTAKVYVETLIASYGERYGNLRVTDVRQSPAADDGEALDVTFTYATDGYGCMTVWVESDGKLYGEW